jgi:hypothetical protein
MVEVINLNEFLRREFDFCWSCGKKEYKEAIVNGHFYRICRKCFETKPRLRKFLFEKGLKKIPDSSHTLKSGVWRRFYDNNTS